MQHESFIGIDVSKDWLDIATFTVSLICRIANRPEAIEAWIATLDVKSIGLVAFESTGGYERVLRRCLVQAGIPFARVHPNEIVAFRARRGVKAKTDRIDALLLAAFAALELSQRGLAPLIETDDVLREMIARRRQLVDVLQAERCRAQMAQGALVQKSLALILAALKASLDEIEEAIAAHVETNAELAGTAALLRTLKGVGPITVYTLLGELPELGRLSGKEIASLVGLAPRNRESGKTQWRATTGHGRPGVRCVLFNAARCAIRWNPVMKAFYERLVQQNRRHGKVALIAVMRKMLVTLNAIAREKQPWSHYAA